MQWAYVHCSEFFLSATTDEMEKQEGNVLTQRYVFILLRKAPIYKGFGFFEVLK